MIRLLNLSGQYDEMGWQHGRQVADLREPILASMQRRLADLDRLQVELRPFYQEVSELWAAAARPTLEMLKGIAAALGFEWEPFFRYTIASYLTDRASAGRHAGAAEGCSVWAAAAPVTRHGAPLMAKNRDYRPDHQSLQCLARAHPQHGYDYIYLTSAGSPGVFSSGMNASGLAVADTHVASADIGPGIARYSAMLEILEHHAQVDSALQYLTAARHLGDGTLTLLDANGGMAVFETGHTVTGIVRPQNGFVVSANHYVTQPLSDRWLDNNPPALRGNSQGRQARLRSELISAPGQVDAAWARQCMAQHGAPLDAICRHPEMEAQAVTIATIVFEPAQRRLWLCNGNPCQAEFEVYPVQVSAM